MEKNQSILWVDATPDEDYPLRILKAYRHQCDYKLSSTTNPCIDETSILCIAMNEMQNKRAAILDKAIALLEHEKPSEVWDDKMTEEITNHAT